MSAIPLSEFAFLAVMFLSAVGVVIGCFLLFGPSQVRNRLAQITGTANTQSELGEPGSRWLESVANAVGPLAKLSAPEENWEQSALRRRFMQAGLRSPSAPILFYAIKTITAFGLPLIAWLLLNAFFPKGTASSYVLILLSLALVGFYGPSVFLNWMIKVRQREIFETFPNAIDLLTICVEAGLGLDAAIARVAEEMRIGSAIVADELTLVSLELRAGSSKERALRNLALRTGVEDIDTLVAMLIQSEKFGTTIGASLRVHSDMLRTKRMQRAEEKAGKLPVKLLFPLIFCIFPSLMVVMLGPSMIRITQTLPGMINGN